MGELKVRSALWVLIEGVAVGDATSETVLAKKASILSFRKVTVLAVVTASAVVGALIGARLTALVNPDSLRQAFGWFVLVMSSVILGQELHPAVGFGAAAAILAAAVVYTVCGRWERCPLRAAKAPVEARAAGG